eukprot:TRINITY_DN15033_c0_g1_i1.p1 TRINITY_DN15033_c0_g1~~TRINITY_DN15033_c0_g1_i1.p1  ORF type:complete len:133 (+),score=0.89 TRINITY_DN15033_c0_g1_i1:36-401(+)
MFFYRLIIFKCSKYPIIPKMFEALQLLEQNSIICCLEQNKLSKLIGCKFEQICHQQQHFTLQILHLLYFIINLKGVEQLQIQIQSVIQEVSTSTFDKKIFTFVIIYQFLVVLLLTQVIVVL